MKKDDISLLIAVVIVAATISFVLSSMLFGYSSKTNSVPVVEAINSNLPDPYNDPTYTAIFNAKAIDPAQLTQIGSQNNNQPFSGTH